MNIEELLNEEYEISQKIKDMLQALKLWFETKIEQVTEIFRTLKDKTINKLIGINIKDKLRYHVYDKDNKKILSKGDSKEKAIYKIKKEFNNAKDISSSIISKCKEGLKSITKKDTKKVEDCKDNVISNLKKLGVTISVIVLLVSVLVGKNPEENINPDSIKLLTSPEQPMLLSKKTYTTNKREKEEMDEINNQLDIAEYNQSNAIGKIFDLKRKLSDPKLSVEERNHISNEINKYEFGGSEDSYPYAKQKVDSLRLKKKYHSSNIKD